MTQIRQRRIYVVSHCRCICTSLEVAGVAFPNILPIVRAGDRIAVTEAERRTVRRCPQPTYFVFVRFGNVNTPRQIPSAKSILTTRAKSKWDDVMTPITVTVQQL